MERIITLHIERLPEGVFLATCDSIRGLVAQGRTIQETLEIARDVARKLLESRDTIVNDAEFPLVGDTLEYPLIVGA